MAVYRWSPCCRPELVATLTATPSNITKRSCALSGKGAEILTVFSVVVSSWLFTVELRNRPVGAGRFHFLPGLSPQ